MTDVVYRFATAADVDALVEVWRGSFPDDTPADIRAFLGLLDLSRECAVAVADGVMSSMTMLLPATLSAGGMEIPLWCVYAAATRPAYRGRGLFGSLLRWAQECCPMYKREGLFLHPASENLYGYYARFGFSTWFYGAPSRRQLPVAHLNSIDASDYAARRETLLAGTPHIVWESRFLQAAGGLYALGDGIGIWDGERVREWLDGSPMGTEPPAEPVGMLWAESARLRALPPGGYMGITLE